MDKKLIQYGGQTEWREVSLRIYVVDLQLCLLPFQEIETGKEKSRCLLVAIAEFVMTYLFNDKLLRIVSQYEYVFPKSSRCSKKKEVINDFWWRSSESLKITKKLLLHNCLSSFLQPCLLCKFEVTVHAENCTQSGSETQLFFAFFALRKLICMYHK